MSIKLNISTEKIFVEFKKHFEIKENDKILFSAKYGTGKTFFLNKFFAEKTIKKRNKVITISPINYSVSQNEDIFELIKADIVRNFFIDKDLQFSSGDNSFDKLTVVKEYVKHSIKHPYKIGKQLIQSLAKIGTLGTPAKDGVDSIFEVINDFENFEKELNEKYKTVEDKAETFSNEIQNKIGTYLEYNFISALITEVLSESKKKNKKDNILVIEDFDRLDPAHIFRILNIFSAHNINERNKFGFDKVIIVCDLQNIESLYRHLYGADIDFNGYIDKFYSIHPYIFDNTKAIYFFLANNFKLPIEDYALRAMSHLLRVLDKDSKIRLRKMSKSSLDKLDNNSILISYDYKKDFPRFFRAAPHIDTTVENIEIYSNDIPLITCIKFLKNLYGGYEELLKVIKNRNEVGRMNSEDSYDYLRLLVVPYYLCRDSSEYHMLFFKSKESLDHPEFQIEGGLVKYITKWNPSNKYLSGSFYEKATLHYIGQGEYLLDFNTAMNILRNFINIGLDKGWLT